MEVRAPPPTLPRREGDCAPALLASGRRGRPQCLPEQEGIASRDLEPLDKGRLSLGFAAFRAKRGKNAGFLLNRNYIKNLIQNLTKLFLTQKSRELYVAPRVLVIERADTGVCPYSRMLKRWCATPLPHGRGWGDWSLQSSHRYGCGPTKGSESLIRDGGAGEVLILSSSSSGRNRSRCRC